MQRKATKEEVRYQWHPAGSQRCVLCSMFVEPNGCTAVEGEIKSYGWCNIFSWTGAKEVAK